MFSSKISLAAAEEAQYKVRLNKSMVAAFIDKNFEIFIEQIEAQ